MSYILDALKKSEKERQRGSLPDALTDHDSLPPVRRKRALWPYFVIVALLLNAGVFLLRSDFMAEKKSRAVTRAVSVEIHAPGEETPATDLLDKESAGRVRGKAGDESAAIISNHRERAGEGGVSVVQRGTQGRASDVRPFSEAVSDRHAPGVTVTGEPAAPTHEEVRNDRVSPPAPNRLYRLSDLPLPLRKKLPEFLVSVFLYSDEPSSRLARINGQVMREGQFLTPDVKLEEIVPGGIIFSCQQYRFLVAPK